MQSFKNTIAAKAAAAFAVAALVVTAGAPVVAAATNATCTNSYTQSNSTNVCQNQRTRTIVINNSNEADVDNTIEIDANTGGNTISSVNGNVGQTTGDIDSTSNVNNDLNKNETEVDLGAGGVDMVGENSNTQSNSDNVVTNVYDDTVEINNDNDLDIENEVFVQQNSGDNETFSVNGDVDNTTGDATVDNEITNDANTNDTTVDGEGDVSITGINNNTQSDSLNLVENVLVTDLEINNENDADIANDVEILQNTGGNTIMDVNGDAGLDTGDADADSAISNGNALNHNTTEVDGWADSIDIYSENDNTQSDSLNTAVATVVLEAEINNENELDVENDVFILSDSGLNWFQEINGDLDFNSGDVDSESDVETHGNDNFTSFEGASDVMAWASNNMTQSNSDNLADNLIVFDLLVDNVNSADLDNENVVLGFSGTNTGMDVNGDVDFGTGDIDLASGLLNDVNYNETEVDNGIDDADLEAENSNTQSGSLNATLNTLVDDIEVENENELDVENDAVVFGDSGLNSLFSINGGVDFDSGNVDEASDAENLGNFNSTTL